MPRRIEVSLSEERRQELLKARNSHRKPYVRERAGAFLKVADGTPASHVAEHGLLRRREPETVPRSQRSAP